MMRLFLCVVFACAAHAQAPVEYGNVRGEDLSAVDFSERAGLIATLWFNERTQWPGPDALPPGEDPAQLMLAAKNPGLGVRELHRRGITGKGVRVAIIDQPMYLDHPEFAGKIAAYHDVGCGSESSMHGPAVASLLVGTTCGTAPGARVHYAAAPSWTKDTAFQARALDWIVGENEKLPAADKIRVVSVSAAPSGPGSPFQKNVELWDEACARATKAGILVLDCTRHRGLIGPCWYDAEALEDVSRCTPGFPGRTSAGGSERILVPCSPRTTAEEYEKGECSWQYCGRGGLSWAIPYCAGVLAMGWQLRPELTPEQMIDRLRRSALTRSDGSKIIRPLEFIRCVEEKDG